ncbi:hypothetical protein EUGRSUZ_B00786 [Eucalyptus grandis]|uniref:Uncharacterized protein n=2 Tax=Eucalyptus grandis TaxID=71139 RepID=A0ACC3LNT7_EUCGR|nr:hypothetical protein EUGRSUZ_B00786 [Eucalyptus grandis]
MRAILAKTNEIIVLESTPSLTFLTVAAINCGPVQKEPHLHNLTVIHSRQASGICININRYTNWRTAGVDGIMHIRVLQCFLGEKSKRIVGVVASTAHWICKILRRRRGAIIIEEEIGISGTQIEWRPFEADIMRRSTTGVIVHEGINHEDRTVHMEDFVNEELTLWEIQDRVFLYTGLLLPRNPKRVADIQAVSAVLRCAGLILRIIRYSLIDYAGKDDDKDQAATTSSADEALEIHLGLEGGREDCRNRQERAWKAICRKVKMGLV